MPPIFVAFDEWRLLRYLYFWRFLEWVSGHRPLRTLEFSCLCRQFLLFHYWISWFRFRFDGKSREIIEKWNGLNSFPKRRGKELTGTLSFRLQLATESGL